MRVFRYLTPIFSLNLLFLYLGDKQLSRRGGLWDHQGKTWFVFIAINRMQMESLNLKQVARALPSPTHGSKSLPTRPGAGKLSHVPACFASIAQRTTSSLPHHRRQRDILEAVGTALPAAVSSFSGSAAAAAYLAALVSSLNRFVLATEPVFLSHSRAQYTLNHPRFSKKQARKKQLEQSRQQELITDASVRALFAPESMSVSDAAMEEKSSVSIQEPDLVPTGDPPQSVGVIASFISLVALALQGCSHAIINLKADAVLECVLTAYNHTSGYVTVAHHTNTVLSTVLAVLSSSAWTSTLVQTAFICMLGHAADIEDAFRSNSRKALDALLNCPHRAVVAAKASVCTATFFVSQLQKRSSTAFRDDLSDHLRSKAIDLLLQLITCINLHVKYLLPPDAARVSVELLVIALKDLPDVSAHAYSALNSTFAARGVFASRNDIDSPLLLQHDLSKLVHAIISHTLPEDCSDGIIVAYTNCVASGAAACVSRFEHSSPPDEFIYKPVQRLIDAINPSCERSGLVRDICRAFEMFLGNQWYEAKPHILTMLRKFLTAKYTPVWSIVIPIVRKYLEYGMCAGREIMNVDVSLLISDTIIMREKAVRDEDWKCVEMVNSLLRSISRGGAASLILSHCPINYDDKLHVTNGWVLAVLRDNICGATLCTFIKQLMPVSEQLNVAMLRKSKEGRVVEAKNIAMYKLQIWDLFPGFCTRPTDLLHEGTLTLCFQTIFSCLTSEAETNMFLVGVGSLRQISQSVLNLPIADPTCKEKISGFTMRFKKLFPTLLGAMEKASDDKRVSMLEAISVACKATHDPDMISTLLKKSVKQLLELQLQLTGGASSGKENEMETPKLNFEVLRKRQHCTADICIAITESNMIPAGAAEIGYLEKAMSPFFFDRKETSLQKKAYRLSAMLISTGVVTRNSSSLMDFIKSTSDAHVALAAGAKAARLGWVTAVVNQQINLAEEQRSNYLNTINSYFLSEVILSTRDSSEKSRSAAYQTLVCMARGWNSMKLGSDVSGLQQFLLLVCAGLGGKSAAMLAGTLHCLGRLIESFRYEIASDEKLRFFVDSMFISKANTNESEEVMATKENEVSMKPGPIAILMRHESVEVQRSAVSVVKVATKCCNNPEGRLLNIVPGILPGLLHVAALSNKQETRLKVRIVLERLMRKCGYEQLEAMFPVEHKKLLLHVRKQYVRAQTRKIGGSDIGSTKYSGEGLGEHQGLSEVDDESGNSDTDQQLIEGDGVIGKFEKQASFEDGEVIDLLESRPTLVSSEQKKMKKRARDTNKKPVDVDIKYSEDGKPIFIESDSSEGAQAGSLSEDDGDSSDDGVIKRREMDIGKLTGKRRMNSSSSLGRHVKKSKGSFGEEYKGRRADGDVKRANHPDPFAYVPLGPSMFNAGTRPGTGGKRSRGSALHRLASTSRSMRKKMRKGRSGLPAKR